MATPCCGSGCDPCALDSTEAANAAEDDSVEGALSPTRYAEFEVVDATIERDGAHALLAFESVGGGRVRFAPGQHVALRVPDGERFVSRAYTPFAFSALDGARLPRDRFGAIVRLREGGRASAYVRTLRAGDRVAFRGPYGREAYARNASRRALIACEGVAVVAGFEMAARALADAEDETLIELLHCCRDESRAVLRARLYDLRDYWNFSYVLYLSRGTNSAPKYNETVICGRMNIGDHVRDDTLLYACGSSAFLESVRVDALAAGLSDDSIIFLR